MLRSVVLAAVAACAFMAVPAPASAQTILDFELVNKTGYGISEIYVAPSASDEWGDSLIEEVLENNEMVKINFHPNAEGIATWDIMVTFVDDDESVYWRGAKLESINRITLKYNRETEETSAVAE